jgi:large subunit ribosomal protein L4
MPRKALRVALKSALLSKFRDGQVALIDALEFEKPGTKNLAGVLGALGCIESCLIVDRKPARNLVLSARNLRRVSVSSVADLNAYDVLLYRNLLVSEDGLEALKEVHTNG